MNSILAISADNYLAKSQADALSWTGIIDKAIFRILTSTNNGHCLVSKRTYANMPIALPGRVLHIVSSTGLSLEIANDTWPNSWLISGPTLIKYAIEKKLLSTIYLCYSNINIFFDCPILPDDVVHNDISDILISSPVWDCVLTTILEHIKIETWRANNG